MRLTFLFLAFLLIVSTISCNKDEDVIPVVPSAPVLVVKNGTEFNSLLNLDIGDTLKITASAQADAGVVSLTLIENRNGVLSTLVDFQSDTLVTNFLMEPLSKVFDYTYAGQVLDYTFVLTDSLMQTDSVIFSVEVSGSPIEVYENVVVGSYGSSVYGNFYNILGDTLYFPNNLISSTANRSNVDLIFSFDASLKWRISSPADIDSDSLWSIHQSIQWPFNNPNSTQMAVVTGLDFSSIVTGSQLLDLLPANLASHVETPIIDHLIAFQLADTRGSRVGLLQITNVTGNTNANRTVVFNLKIQQ